MMQAGWELDRPEGLQSPPRGGEGCSLFVFSLNNVSGTGCRGM